MYFLHQYGYFSLFYIFIHYVVFFTSILSFFGKKKPSCDGCLDFVVELPDTASGSESSRGHGSTYIVSCFVLANVLSCKKPNLKLPWLIFVLRFATHTTLFPYYDNSYATEPCIQTSLQIIRHKLACTEHAQFSCFLHLLILTVFNRYASRLLMIRLSFVSPNLFYYTTKNKL